MKKQAAAALAVVVLLAGIAGTENTGNRMSAAAPGSANTATADDTGYSGPDTTAKSPAENRTDATASSADDAAGAACAAQSAAQGLCGLPLAQNDTDDALPRTLMLEGNLYVDLGEVSDSPRCGMLDGQVTEVCPAGTLPTQDGQANFGTPGMGYQWSARGVEVYFEEQWHCFALLCIGG